MNYQQLYKGIPVWRAYVGFTVHQNGKVILAGSDAHPDITIETAAKLNSGQAEEIAAADIRNLSKDGGYTLLKEPELIIFPLEEKTKYEYYLAYNLELSSGKNESYREDMYFIDANSGTIIKRYSKLREDRWGRDNKKKTHASLALTMQVTYWPEHYNDATTTVPAENQNLQLFDSEDYYVGQGTTNSSGQYTFGTPDNGNYKVVADLKSSYVSVTNDPVNREHTKYAPGTYTITQGADDGSNVFYHVNNIHGIFKDSPFNYNSMDYQMLAYLTEDTTYNGWSNGTNIGFGRQGLQYWARSSDVVYHEYSHSTIYHLYGNSWIDTANDYDGEAWAMDEGLADYWAITINDDPVQGESVGVSRNHATNYLYTDLGNLPGYDPSVQGAHLNGMIIGGACWDLRSSMGTATGNEYVFDALQMTPHADTFQEFGENVAAADDVDGDLTTSCPHYSEIKTAFNTYHSIPFTVVGTPLAPTGLSVQNGSTGISVSWNSTSNTTRYKLYRKTTGAYSQIANTVLTSYTDEYVTQGTAYTYQVKAENDAGQSDGSSEEQITAAGPLGVNVSYDTAPAQNEWVTFTASVTNGSGNYTYAWYRAPENDPGNWTQVGSNSSSLYIKCDVWGFYLKVEVDDNNTFADGNWNNSYGMAKPAGEMALPVKYELFANYPNPFNPETTIRFALPEAANVTLRIYDMNGRLVRELVNGRKPGGYHNAVWDGRNSAGEHVASGAYVYRISAGSFEQSAKMVLMK